MDFATIKKYLVSVVGFCVVVATSVLATNPEIIPAGLLPWLQAAIGVVITTGIYKVKNKDILTNTAPTEDTLTDESVTQFTPKA